MEAEDLAGVVLVVSLILYAVFGGADFGGGIWTLLASGPRRKDQRDALERAIGPVWETNHVWLILLVVTLFVVFPTAYAAIFTALYVPLFLALIGIVARGAAFAFRHYGARDIALGGLALRAFSVASLLTPFTLGLCLGAVSSGDIHVSGDEVQSGSFDGWLDPFALICGLIGLAVCAFVAACFMVPRSEGPLRRDFRSRAITASLVLGALTTVAIPVAHGSAGPFSDRLGRPEVIAGIAVTVTLGLATLGAVWRGLERPLPPLAGATVGGLISTWAWAMHPNLVLPGLTLSQAAAEGPTVRAFLIALPFGAAILLPSLGLLYLTFSRDTFAAGETRQSH